MDRFQLAVDGVGVQLACLFAEQPQDDRAIGAVPHAGKRERAVKVGMDFDGRGQQILRVQREQESTRGTHGTHGVRTRWTDADFVEIEQRGFHDWLW